VNWEAKLTLTCAPYMNVGLRMIATSFRPGSERRKVKALIIIDRSARVALVQTGPSMGVHAQYGRLWPSSPHSSLDVGRVPSDLWWMGTPWKTRRIWPLLGISSKMFRPKGWRRASRYLSTVAVVGRPVNVSVKLEDRGLHHLPARIVSLGETLPSCWRMCVSIAWIRA